jgi:predicted RNase H-related nuclease YkuK (DUF458 family)
MTPDTLFISPSQGKLTLSKLVNEISRFMKEEPDGAYRLIIGSDSQIKREEGKKVCDFVTAIVVHREGMGARYFWNREKAMRAPTLREKIYTETMRSLDTAQTLLPLFGQVVSPTKYELEIHIDVGQVGETREMIREVVGMVTGSGFTAKTKPNSWAASTVADKHT